ncbi:DNA alkylation repair protein [candidate division KSB1 bacterium]
MNIDVKIETKKIAHEIINGSIEQAVEDYEHFIGNYHFLTSSNLDKTTLNHLGTNLAKYVRKNPPNFMLFSKQVWYNAHVDGRHPVGIILAALENIIPDEVIEEAIEMCRDANGVEDVDSIVTGFEPVILRDPDTYFPVLQRYLDDDCVWVKRVIIITLGHIMFRYKNDGIVTKCLDMLRPEIEKNDEEINNVVSWILASYGVRADQKAVLMFIQSYEESDNHEIVKLFCDALKKSKISLQKDICQEMVLVFEHWCDANDKKMSRHAKGALKILNKQLVQ